ncbi:demethylmenaquinone methyltransferase [Luteimicrobium xylanilyticum]|uniref:Putative 4-hydroxy-4-methyl-2-oxoglutarate aldolase n=1 Tax=Luteimicrobium xylanilyticum TaxID=1133546 RepID=A0A5P9Q5D0_9MICO|nr:dimethylmenaquinone methyltransferase [Luteimicrobium xylanilyticum]QFU96564.1 4-hydroxy-4-methyl-2-oxoglutarate aldolase [Luteimicrobium xylanilyticum]
MDAATLQTTFVDLSTPHLADACLRLRIPVRCAPARVRPLWSGVHVAGRVRPTQHCGSVDVFLEALERSDPGDVLVVDNQGREDEACVGDLVALEVARAGLEGIVIWGLHRDTAQLRSIGLPVLSEGAYPNGPERLTPQPADALDVAQVGAHTVTAEDLVVADDDGAIFVPLGRASEVAEAAARIRDTELAQAARMADGTSLREQTRFADYLAARADGVTFRQHLRSLAAAIEE